MSRSSIALNTLLQKAKLPFLPKSKIYYDIALVDVGTFFSMRFAPGANPAEKELAQILQRFFKSLTEPGIPSAKNPGDDYKEYNVAVGVKTDFFRTFFKRLMFEFLNKVMYDVMGRKLDFPEESLASSTDEYKTLSFYARSLASTGTKVARKVMEGYIEQILAMKYDVLEVNVIKFFENNPAITNVLLKNPVPEPAQTKPELAEEAGRTMMINNKKIRIDAYNLPATMPLFKDVLPPEARETIAKEMKSELVGGNRDEQKEAVISYLTNDGSGANYGKELGKLPLVPNVQEKKKITETVRDYYTRVLVYLVNTAEKVENDPSEIGNLKENEFGYDADLSQNKFTVFFRFGKYAPSVLRMAYEGKMKPNIFAKMKTFANVAELEPMIRSSYLKIYPQKQSSIATSRSNPVEKPATIPDDPTNKPVDVEAARIAAKVDKAEKDASQFKRKAQLARAIAVEKNEEAKREEQIMRSAVDPRGFGNIKERVDAAAASARKSAEEAEEAEKNASAVLDSVKTITNSDPDIQDTIHRVFLDSDDTKKMAVESRAAAISAEDYANQVQAAIEKFDQRRIEAAQLAAQRAQEEAEKKRKQEEEAAQKKKADEIRLAREAIVRNEKMRKEAEEIGRKEREQLEAANAAAIAAKNAQEEARRKAADDERARKDDERAARLEKKAALEAQKQAEEKAAAGGDKAVAEDKRRQLEAYIASDEAKLATNLMEKYKVEDKNIPMGLESLVKRVRVFEREFFNLVRKFPDVEEYKKQIHEGVQLVALLYLSANGLVINNPDMKYLMMQTAIGIPVVEGAIDIYLRDDPFGDNPQLFKATIENAKKAVSLFPRDGRSISSDESEIPEIPVFKFPRTRISPETRRRPRESTPPPPVSRGGGTMPAAAVVDSSSCRACSSDITSDLPSYFGDSRYIDRRGNFIAQQQFNAYAMFVAPKIAELERKRLKYIDNNYSK